METIVVGADGSPAADEAVRFAAHEARLRNAALRMVTARYVPAAVYGGIGVAIVDPGNEFEKDADRCLEETAKRLDAELGGLDVEPVAREGAAGRVLVEESADAALLVVGSRGHGGFVGMLIGSVSGQVCSSRTLPGRDRPLHDLDDSPRDDLRV